MTHETNYQPTDFNDGFKPHEPHSAQMIERIVRAQIVSDISSPQAAGMYNGCHLLYLGTEMENAFPTEEEMNAYLLCSKDKERFLKVFVNINGEVEFPDKSF